MPDVVFAILQTMIALGHGARPYELEDSSGYSLRTLRRFLPPIERRGWCQRSPWRITERGKLVFAIETGRRTKARALGVPVVRQQARSFEVSVP